MRRKIKFLVLVFFLATVGLLVYKFYGTFQEKQSIVKKIAHLPEFSLYSTHGTLTTHNNIEQGNWAVFIFFNSECHYCQEEAQQLAANKETLKSTTFIWLSSEDMETITGFQKKYHLDNTRDIIFLQDMDSHFANSLQIESTPHFLIYSPTGNLVKTHKGALRIDKLLEQISNEFETP